MYLNPIIFLDFDGVINTRFCYYVDDILHYDFFHEEDMKVNNLNAINLLNKLCLEFNADIVVTSSWRKYNDQDKDWSTKKVLINSGLNEQINVLGDVPILDTSVGDEVRFWLLENNYPINHPLIILDDGCDPKEFFDNYVKTNFDDGFTEKEYNITTEKLNELINQKRLFLKK